MKHHCLFTQQCRRLMAETFNRHPLTAKARGEAQADVCRIFSRQNNIGTCFH
jgi:hypothetical protein